MKCTCILLRYGEVGLKTKRTRGFFEKHYLRAIKDGLKRSSVEHSKITNLGGRFIIYLDKPQEACEVLGRIPGIQSYAPALHFDFETKDDILKVAYEATKDAVVGKTFAVKAKRSGSHDFTSMELAGDLGVQLGPHAKGVDLKNPQQWVWLEVRDKQCFVYVENFDGIGGLPPRTAGKVLALFSGGIDSPVASYMMLKRGCMLDFVFVNLLGDKSANDVMQIYNYISAQYAFGYKPLISIIDGKKLVEKIIADVPSNMRQIALKIVFYKLGEKLAQKYGYYALVTGEALSQKSSQTVQSLHVIDSQINTPVLRPLIGMDKIEISKIASRIGTMARSEKIKEYCNLADGAVTTTPTMDDLSVVPDFDALIDEAIENVVYHKGIVKVEESQPEDMSSFKNIVTVDMRPQSLQEAHPIKADMHSAYPQILDELEQFEKGNTYLLICDFGVKSEDVAHTLRSRGIKAAGVSLPNFLKYFNKK